MPSRQDVEDSYKATEYVVYANGNEFVLKVGEYSPSLRSFYDKFGVTSILHITAWNPHSQCLSVEANKQRQALLLQAILDKNLTYCRGFGRDPTGEWAGEEHLVVFDADIDTASQFAQEFEQNAVLWCGPSAIPELLWFTD